MIVAGVGFRRGVAADELVRLVQRACREAALVPGRVARLATLDALADEPGFAEAARQLELPPLRLARAALLAAAPGIATRSARSLAAHGVGSVAEAAALGGAGAGARLVLTRIASARATCALAEAPS